MKNENGTPAAQNGRVHAAPNAVRKALPRSLTTFQDLRVLHWTAEQYAIRLDHLAEFQDRSLRTAQRCARRLEVVGWARTEALQVGESSWLYLTERGARVAGGQFRAWTPTVARLPHITAVNAVRLHIAKHAPDATWICERMLARDRTDAAHIPDGVVQTDDEAHAVEVELVPKARKRVVQILDELCHDYDAVVYFCTPSTRRQLERLASQGWPELSIRNLPVLDR